MAKKEVKEEEVCECETKVVVNPILENFTNGDLNTLRDKINEIIARG